MAQLPPDIFSVLAHLDFWHIKREKYLNLGRVQVSSATPGEHSCQDLGWSLFIPQSRIISSPFRADHNQPDGAKWLHGAKFQPDVCKQNKTSNYRLKSARLIITVVRFTRSWISDDHSNQQSTGPLVEHDKLTYSFVEFHFKAFLENAYSLSGGEFGEKADSILSCVFWI